MCEYSVMCLGLGVVYMKLLGEQISVHHVETIKRAHASQLELIAFLKASCCC